MSYLWYLLIVGGMVGMVLSRTGKLPAVPDWIFYIPIGLFFVALFVIYGKMMFPKAGTLALDGDMLSLTTGKGTSQVTLQGATFLLGKHFSDKNMAMFTGTVLHLDNRQRGERLRVLGAGVELESNRYAASDSYAADYEIYMPNKEFKELMELVFAEGGAAPDTSAAKDPKDATLVGGELSFEAWPTKKTGGVAWVMIPLLFILGGGGAYLASQLIPQEKMGEFMPFFGVGFIVVFFTISILFSKRKMRGQLRIGQRGLTYLINDKERKTLRPPFRDVKMLKVVMSSRHASYYSGPGLLLKDSAGQKLKILINDRSLAWNAEDKQVGSCEIYIGRDAGDSLMAWLATSGVDLSQLVDSGVGQ